MDTILSLFSPRKRAPEPPKPLPHPRGRTYSRKDRIRAKRASLGQIGDSDTRSPRNRTSNASSITASHDTSGEISYLEEHETTVKMNTPGTDSRSPIDPKLSLTLGSSPRDNEMDVHHKRTVRKRITALEGSDEEMTDPQDEAEHDFEAEDGHDGGQQEDAKHEQVEQEEDDEAYSFNKILGYRWFRNKIQLQIDWSEQPSTWEPEENIHRDAPDALFDYWRSKGGRPDNPKKPGVYDIFAIRNHSKNKKKVLVEWVGYDESEHTWEERKKIERAAKALVDDYFDGLKKGEK
ncbi:hypothetical protein N0V84_001828 [Fusarium piperis]|uniref:Chromo domain-containing protein n=1 Tax=Fusarium piperis TaxID=1435070 RepID=A0A9W8WKC0_9HYPO|nr:hypothetical protein N0V84_001828 [Fusarium piperis]